MNVIKYNIIKLCFVQLFLLLYNKNMDYNEKYEKIINTKMTLHQKKEMLLQLILKLDEETDRSYRKNFILKIQRLLYILDNILEN